MQASKTGNPYGAPHPPLKRNSSQNKLVQNIPSAGVGRRSACGNHWAHEGVREMNIPHRLGRTGLVLTLAIILTLAAVVTTSNTPALANSAPDLEVGTPSVNDATLYTGNQFTLSVTVTNAGDGASEATTLRYYRSADSTITSSDTAQGSESVGALAAAGTSDHDGGMTAPSEAGTYYYGTCVDSVTDESDTTDNCSSSVTVTVSEPAPDLAVLARIHRRDMAAAVRRGKRGQGTAWRGPDAVEMYDAECGGHTRGMLTACGFGLTDASTPRPALPPRTVASTDRSSSFCGNCK